MHGFTRLMGINQLQSFHSATPSAKTPTAPAKPMANIPIGLVAAPVEAPAEELVARAFALVPVAIVPLPDVDVVPPL